MQVSHATDYFNNYRSQIYLRQELATREHMLDHGQLGTAAPASNTPTTPSVHPLDPLHSTSQHLVDKTTVSTSNTIDDEWHLIPHVPSTSSPPMKPDLAGTTAEDIPIDALQVLGRGLSDAVVTGVNDEKLVGQDEGNTTSFSSNGLIVNHYIDPNTSRETMAEPQTTHITSSAELTPQLLANPKLAASRSPAARGLQQNVPPHTLSKQSPAFASSPPILINPKCSGYFVEPVSGYFSPDSFRIAYPSCQMKWMEHFLSSGQLGGKITCPNKKCGTKLGNYDWAGMCCGCSHWVTPVRSREPSVYFLKLSSLRQGVLHQPIKGRRNWLDLPSDVFEHMQMMKPVQLESFHSVEEESVKR